MEHLTSTGTRWYESGFELRLAEPGGSGPCAVRVLVRADGRAQAARLLDATEAQATGTERAPREARPVVRRRPLSVVPSDADRPLHPELLAVATVPWTVVEGCLVHDADDADVIALEWLEVNAGSTARTEAVMNRLHLWDYVEEDEAAPRTRDDELDLALDVARAWRHGLDLVPCDDPVVIEVRASHDGPELTVYRAEQDGRAAA